MNRFDVLEAATATVADREDAYGKPADSFETVAQIWNAILGPDTLKEPLNGADVVMLMIGLKLARLTVTPDHADSQVDLAGYASLLSEVTSKQK
jgi:hypothetical protein